MAGVSCEWFLEETGTGRRLLSLRLKKIGPTEGLQQEDAALPAFPAHLQPERWAKPQRIPIEAGTDTGSGEDSSSGHILKPLIFEISSGPNRMVNR